MRVPQGFIALTEASNFRFQLGLWVHAFPQPDLKALTRFGALALGMPRSSEAAKQARKRTSERGVFGRISQHACNTKAMCSLLEAICSKDKQFLSPRLWPRNI